jgi:transcriptional regulator
MLDCSDPPHHPAVEDTATMYQPEHFREDRLDVQHALIRAHPLGLLISHGAGGLTANPVPFLLYGPTETAPLGTLRAHVARANPQWRDFLEGDRPGGAALVVFQGVDTYVTPSWYATKRETGKVVPTWNYAIVQVHGRPRVIEDDAWLARQIEALTSTHEGGRPEPWAVSDAPERYVEVQRRGIVGLEVAIDRIDGKWKVSQNRPEADRRGVAEGLDAAEDERARAMGALVAAYGRVGPA